MVILFLVLQEKQSRVIVVDEGAEIPREYDQHHKHLLLELEETKI